MGEGEKCKIINDAINIITKNIIISIFLGNLQHYPEIETFANS